MNCRDKLLQVEVMQPVWAFARKLSAKESYVRLLPTAVLPVRPHGPCAPERVPSGLGGPRLSGARALGAVAHVSALPAPIVGLDFQPPSGFGFLLRRAPPGAHHLHHLEWLRGAKVPGAQGCFRESRTSKAVVSITRVHAGTSRGSWMLFY